MLVFLYVHFHPYTGRGLPFESKPPYLTVVYLILTAVNIYLFMKSKKLSSYGKII